MLLTVQGTGFSSVPWQNWVTVGGTACAPMASTSTILTCVCGQRTGGRHPVRLRVSPLNCTSVPPGGVPALAPAFVDSLNVTAAMLHPACTPEAGGAAGDANFTSPSSAWLEVAPVVRSMWPRTGSAVGGTRLLLKGEGFSNTPGHVLVTGSSFVKHEVPVQKMRDVFCPSHFPSPCLCCSSGWQGMPCAVEFAVCGSVLHSF
jgi:hypothetical protein